MLAFLAGIVVSDPNHFVWLMAGSCGAVLVAALLYTSFALRWSCGRGGDGLLDSPKLLPEGG